MAKKWLERFGSAKTRALLLLVLVLAIFAIVVFLVSTHKSTPLETEQSRAAAIPQITSVPGQVTSEKYQQLLETANVKRAQEAEKKGTSALPTIIGSRDKDALAKKESFGIEDQFLKAGGCKCEEGGEVCQKPLDPTLAASLIAQIVADPTLALKLMQDNPCLGKALCTQNPDLALKVIEKDPVAAKIMLNECPAMAKSLAEKNPALFKQLMLDNPALAKKIATTDPELLKKLMLSDPEFAKAMAKNNPEVLKTLLKNDPAFADQLYKQNPDIIKDLMKGDTEFAKIMAKNNPALVKDLMLKDPEFAKLMVQNNPDMVKELMKNDSDFANALAKADPDLVKELMKNDPEFAAIMAKQNPDMVKKLMADDPAFAALMAKQNPDMVKKLMADDPAFAALMAKQNPDMVTALRGKQKAQIQEATQRQIQLNELQQKQVATLLANMEAQSKNFAQTWDEVNPQSFVQGELANKEDTGKEGNVGGAAAAIDQGGSAAGTVPPSKVLVKAGTIMYAVLDTSVNTDEPGPILATIVQGQFKGGKLIGAIQKVNPVAGQRPEKVTLSFTTLSLPNAPNSISISGVAVDPDTERTALASDVDHHYLLRYGTMFASSFMAGYSKVITSEGTVQTTAQNGLASTTTTPQLSGRKEIFAALGEVGKNWSDSVKDYVNTPNTITVDAGTGFGLLVLSDVNGS